MIPNISLVGLGNPGSKYARTRHNAGKLFVSWLKNQSHSFNLIELDSFMNQSGPALKKKLPQNQSFIVAHDDLDLALGKFKLQLAKGPKNHKGLISIYQALGNQNFYHLRLGVDTRPNHSIPGDEYVLKNFSKKELETLQSTFPQILQSLPQVS